jgi:hypothetical protein
MVKFIKKQRESQLDGKIADRGIKVINTNNSVSNLRQFLLEIDQKELTRMKEMHLNEDKLEVA